MKYTVIINCNLEYEIEAKDESEAEALAQEIELPPQYVEDSYEVTKIFINQD